MKFSTIFSTGLLVAATQANLCFDAGKAPECTGGSSIKCIPAHNGGPGSGQDGTSYCSFYCSKIKSKADCEAAKKNTNILIDCNKVKYC
ncbi:putative secreted protein [Wickerhamomyces ciferrii]|uniref:Secreted protein n=1 Tax=Wickerhamomyces ciferrii (strain ATCC 14091 / BCRC 22168 / CBS 111 / JCM 3599 / NBRC 0793 / NRRL Y-1031 F-60-10) TaxID=1206466 RepID=K0KQR5_WICCF|nr:uncharacterized protein BN7_4041 [Wickerhamomyces ciferrii]CCH44477.1 putative secreted protein [Wickerhamomyces ciferrii]